MCVLISIWEWETVKEYICKIYLFLKRVWLWIIKPDQVIQDVRRAISIFLMIYYPVFHFGLISSIASYLIFIIVLPIAFFNYLYSKIKDRLKMGICSIVFETILFFFLTYLASWVLSNEQILVAVPVVYAILWSTPKTNNE